MNTFDATMIAEGVQEADEATTVEAWQHLIDTGLAWQLQGWFGRTANDLILQGICHHRYACPNTEADNRRTAERPFAKLSSRPSMTTAMQATPAPSPKRTASPSSSRGMAKHQINWSRGSKRLGNNPADTSQTAPMKAAIIAGTPSRINGDRPGRCRSGQMNGCFSA